MESLNISEVYSESTGEFDGMPAFFKDLIGEMINP